MVCADDFATLKWPESVKSVKNRPPETITIFKQDKVARIQSFRSERASGLTLALVAQ
jgi:hypothetical protein